MDSHPDLAVVIVTWNVRDLLSSCLLTVGEDLRRGNLRGEIYVVDNASADGTRDLVRDRFPDVRLIANDHNEGFAKGNNQALRLAQAPYALLLNPDTTVTPGALRAMVDYLDAHPDVGVVGPRLLYPDGADQPSRRRFPKLATALLESTPLQRCFPNHRALLQYYFADRDPQEEHDVDWLVGASLLVRREVWHQIGLLDEAFFMYSEEMDWCRRIKLAGWRIVYLPRATIVHHEARSSGQNVLARHQRFHDSRALYFRKHHGRLPAFAVRLITVLGFAWMLSEETIKYVLVPQKREGRRSVLPVLSAALRYHTLQLIGRRVRVAGARSSLPRRQA